MHKILFYSKFIIFLYVLQALCAHHREIKIVLYSIWYRQTCRWLSRAEVERGLVQSSLDLCTVYAPPSYIYKYSSTVVPNLFDCKKLLLTSKYSVEPHMLTVVL